ncbi:hypothetical protein VQ643_06540 [Pseudomonas sp. F1_0610]|uniref:hypothetical protein n=1 Tax=Pseudomonas sp. F1_0610 TaxID=3114284 RepID=UPI0039C39A68
MRPLFYLCLALVLSLSAQAAPLDELASSATQVQCKDTVYSPEGIELADECYYPNTAIKQAYVLYVQAMLENMPELKTMLLSDTYQLTQQSDIFVWKNKHELIITDDFSVGISQVIFRFDGKGTQVVTVYLPD